MVAELIHEQTRVIFKAHAKKGTQAPPPLKVPRPTYITDKTRPPKKQATSEELARFFGGRNVVINYTPKEP